MRFPFYNQHDAMDCGPACLRMIAEYYGRQYPLQWLREHCYANRNGVSMQGISDGAEHIGLRTLGVRTSFERLAKKVILPCIVHWRQDHFVVVYKIKVRRHKDGFKGAVYVADPAYGLVKYSVEEFLDGWLSTKEGREEKGMALMVVPTMNFYEAEFEEETKRHKISWFFSYLRPHRKLLVQVILGMLLGMVIQLIFPFLTQSMIDVGVLNSNLNFIVLILISQLILSFSQMSIGFIQSWIYLHMSTRINVSLISDFLLKLLNLPMRFFDSKKTGDIMQRIGDHGRIQSFLTGTSINTMFSFVNFFVFAGILAWYNTTILIIFLLGHAVYVGWVLLFLRIRRDLDFKRFERSARNQSNIIQLISGVQEIKLNNCERKMRWRWETIQAELFDVSIKGLSVGQVQSVGAFFINQFVSIILTVIAARAVVEGQMTLGMMMSLSYILGQLRGPVESFIGFVHAYQDAKISLERLGEVHFKEDENQQNELKMCELPTGDKSILLKDVSFSYLGPSAPPVLDHIDLDIKEKKITAIVGASGSGKTTLLKLLTGHYMPDSGELKVGITNLKNINSHIWRSKCGTVMQDGYIFSENIAENISVSSEYVDKDRLYNAAVTANAHEFIETLPSAYNTKIGQEGTGISQGQKQRILIARAVYKDPEYLFFDEATNSLDANNEKIIMDNLHRFFEGRTVVVVAHRLSTVRHADNIVVMDKGKIVEQGTHEELVELKGEYYHLVKNQLELGM